MQVNSARVFLERSWFFVSTSFDLLGEWCKQSHEEDDLMIRVNRCFSFCPFSFKSLYFLSLDLRLLISPLLFSDFPFAIFWFPLCYLLISPLLSSDFPFAIFWFLLWYLLISPLLFSDFPFDIFWFPLCYLLISPLLSSGFPFTIF